MIIRERLLTWCDGLLCGKSTCTLQWLVFDSEELKERIISAFVEMTAEMRHNTMQEYRDRLARVVKNDGHHVEARIS